MSDIVNGVFTGRQITLAQHVYAQRLRCQLRLRAMPLLHAQDDSLTTVACVARGPRGEVAPDIA
jgi:hypothetical protein